MTKLLRITRALGHSKRMADIVIGLCILLATGCSGSIMMDVTPPPDYQPTHQILATDPAAVDISPLLPPDPMAGKIVYVENCAPCHGLTAMGDGERVGSLPSIPQPLGSLDYSRKISPTIWFQTVTQGKIEKLMPGFGSSLSDRQRWDVVAYLLSLGITSGQQADGEQVFSQYCQECHGQNGKSGLKKTSILTESDQLQKSLDGLGLIMTYGKGSMPAMGDKLTEEQILNSAIYIRSQAFAQAKVNPNPADIQTTIIPSPVAVSPDQTNKGQVISGEVINGSGQPVPPDLSVELTGYDAMQPVFTQKQVVDNKGMFTFQQVPEETGRIYLLTVTYKGNTFTSTDMHSGKPDELENQQVMIYEATTDASKIKAVRMHIFFEFPRSDVIQVAQLFILSNPTTSLITASRSGTPVITFPLPPGAGNLQFQGGSLGERFVLARDGFGDTQAIPPGSGTQVLFSFELPYNNDLLIPLRISLPVDTTNIMLPSKGVNVKSSQLQDLGEKSIQNAVWHIYTSGSLAAGSRLDLLVSGKPKVADPQEEELNTNLAIGVIALSFVVIVVSSLIYQKVNYRKSIKQPETESTLDQAAQDAVLDAIIALDDQFHAGQIPMAAYQERRADLKNRLREGRS